MTLRILHQESSPHHGGVEHPGQQQDDQEIDQGHGRRRPRSNWPSAILTRSIDSKRRRVAGPAAGQHEGLGVDVELSMKRSRTAMVSTRFSLGNWI
jgi:hypothetical protein